MAYHVAARYVTAVRLCNVHMWHKHCAELNQPRLCALSLQLFCSLEGLQIVKHYKHEMDGRSSLHSHVGFSNENRGTRLSPKFSLISEIFFRDFRTIFAKIFDSIFANIFAKTGHYFRENRSTSKSVNLVISTINQHWLKSCI